MAKKKVNLPAYVLKQFDKAMYKIGDEVIISWLGQKRQVMLRNIINAIGVWLTQLKSRNLIRARANAAQLDTLAESKLKNIPQITKLDASYTNKPKNLGNLDLDEFMKTPEAQQLKSKLVAEAAETMIIAITEKLQDPETMLPQRLVLSLALQECTETMQKHEAWILQ